MTHNNQQIIEVLPYDPNWSKQFEHEATLLPPIFKDNIIKIHHIGSTAIPMMYAKPVIDIMLEVNRIELVDACNDAMIKVGYEAWGEFGILGRRFFLKGAKKRTHHVHAFQTRSFDIKRHIYFRNYLIAHESEAKAYADLKIHLAEQFRENRRAYTESKNNFVKSIEQKAINFYS